MRVIRANEVWIACPMGSAIVAVREGFAALSNGHANVPVRSSVELRDGGVLLTMPASITGEASYSVKLATVCPTNSRRGMPLVTASVLLGDAVTGTPRALIDGTALTALRTGAAGGLAAQILARPDSAVVALFGAGAQARTQLRGIATAFDLKEVRIVARSIEHARGLITEAASWPELANARLAPSTMPEALRGADIVITATDSSTPVFSGSSLGNGVHVTAVGSFRPTMRELDEETMRDARVVVDQRAAALSEAGELQGMQPSRLTEIGEIIAGRAGGRDNQQERTIFKSVGNAVQDLVVAKLIYERATELGLGQEIDFP